ncbi:hypothetical protein U1Q18_052081, partial [Sarracenia purpurea var. burkii]
MAEVQGKIETLSKIVAESKRGPVPEPGVQFQVPNLQPNPPKINNQIEKLKTKMYYKSLPTFDGKEFVNPHKFLDEFERITKKLEIDGQTKADWLIMS